MRPAAIITIVIAVALIIGAFFLWRCEDDWCFVFDWQKERAADSFERCVELGFPVMESNPQQCRAGDKLFIQAIGDGEPEEGVPVETSMIKVTAPLPGSLVRSPLTVRGEARGNWYFEASFPLKLLDANGKEIAVSHAEAQGDWMTTEFVPFVGTISFSAPTTPTGTLVLEKDNPSGLEEHRAEIRIPVRFDVNAQEQTVKLYYYDQSKDKDASGNLLCSSKGVVAVDRNTPVTITPIQDAIRLLLRGELTQNERASGITTEFPLPGVELRAASLTGGVLTLTFADPQNKTTGGSCRVSILRAQIEVTAKQFSGVTQVRFMPAGVFEP